MKRQLVRSLLLIVGLIVCSPAAARPVAAEDDPFSPFPQPFSVFPTTKKVSNLIKRRGYSAYDFGSIFLASSKDPKHTGLGPLPRKLPSTLTNLFRQYATMGYSDAPSKPVLCGSCPDFPNYVSYYPTATCLGLGNHFMVLLTVYMSSLVARMNTDFAQKMDYLKVGKNLVEKVTLKAFQVQVKSKDDLIISRQFAPVLEVDGAAGPDAARAAHFSYLQAMIQAIKKTLGKPASSDGNSEEFKKLKTNLNKFLSKGLYGTIANAKKLGLEKLTSDPKSHDDFLQTGEIGASIFDEILRQLEVAAEQSKAAGKGGKLEMIVRDKLAGGECPKFYALFQITLFANGGKSQVPFFLLFDVSGREASAKRLTFPIHTSLFLPADGNGALDSKGLTVGSRLTRSPFGWTTAPGKWPFLRIGPHVGIMGVDLNINGYFDRPGAKENTVACKHVSAAVSKALQFVTKVGFAGVQFEQSCRVYLTKQPESPQQKQQPTKKQEEVEEKKEKDDTLEKQTGEGKITNNDIPVQDELNKEPGKTNEKPGDDIPIEQVKTNTETTNLNSKEISVATNIDVGLTQRTSVPVVEPVEFEWAREYPNALDCPSFLAMTEDTRFHQLFPELARLYSFKNYLAAELGVLMDCSPRLECDAKIWPAESGDSLKGVKASQETILTLRKKGQVIFGMWFTYAESSGTDQATSIWACFQSATKLTQTQAGRHNCFNIDFNGHEQIAVLRNRGKAIKFYAKSLQESLEVLAVYLLSAVQPKNLKQLFYFDLKGLETMPMDDLKLVMEMPFPIHESAEVQALFEAEGVVFGEHVAFSQATDQWAFVANENSASRDKETFSLNLNLKHDLFKPLGIAFAAQVEATVTELPEHNLLLALKMGANSLQITIPAHWDVDTLFGREHKWEAQNFGSLQKKDLTRRPKLEELLAVIRNQSLDRHVRAYFLGLKLQYLARKFGRAILGWIMDNLAYIPVTKTDINRLKLTDGAETAKGPSKKGLMAILERPTMSFGDCLVLLCHAMAEEGLVDIGLFQEWAILNSKFSDDKNDESVFRFSIIEFVKQLTSARAPRRVELTDDLDSNAWFLDAESYFFDPRNVLDDGSNKPKAPIHEKTGKVDSLTLEKVRTSLENLRFVLARAAAYVPVPHLRASFRPVAEGFSQDKSFGKRADLPNTFFDIELFEYRLDFWNVVHFRLENRFFDAEYLLFASDPLVFYGEVLRMVRDFVGKAAKRQKLKMEGSQTFIATDGGLTDAINKAIKDKNIGSVCFQKDQLGTGTDASSVEPECRSEAVGARETDEKCFPRLGRWVFSEAVTGGEKVTGGKEGEIPDCDLKNLPDNFSYLDLVKTKQPDAPPKKGYMWTLQLLLVDTRANKHPGRRQSEPKVVLYEHTLHQRYDYSYKEVLEEFLAAPLARLSPEVPSDDYEDMDTGDEGGINTLQTSMGLNGGSPSKGVLAKKKSFLERAIDLGNEAIDYGKKTAIKVKDKISSELDQLNKNNEKKDKGTSNGERVLELAGEDGRLLLQMPRMRAAAGEQLGGTAQRLDAAALRRLRQQGVGLAAAFRDKN